MADNVLETGHFECILANKNYKEEKTLMLKKRQLTTIALALTFIMLFASVAGAVTVPTNVYYTNAEDQVVKANYEAAGDAYDAGNTAMWNALKSGIISAMRAGKAVVVETATKTVNYLDAALAGKTLEEATTDTAYDTTNPTVDKELDTSGNVVDPGTTAVTVTAITATPATLEVDNGTAKADVLTQLPAKVTLTLNQGDPQEVDVTAWDCATYDPAVAADYTFEATFTLPENVTNPDNKKGEVVVTVKAAPAVAVSSVIATNGTVTVTFAEAVTEVPAGLVILKDGVDLALATDKFAVADGKVVATVPTIIPTQVAQSVVYSAKLGTADAVAAEALPVAADTTAPVVTTAATSVNVTAAAQAYTFTVADEANGSGIALADITVTQGTTALTVTETATAGTYQVSLNGVQGANQTLTINAKDKAANAATAKTVTLVDKIKPTITNVQALNNKTIVVTFSEPVADSALTVGNLGGDNAVGGAAGNADSAIYSLYNTVNGTNTYLTDDSANESAVAVVVTAAFANTDKTQIKFTIIATTVAGFPQAGLANGGYIFYASSVDDRATVANTIITASPYEFTGTLTPDATSANAVTASFNKGTGEVIINFDKQTIDTVPADDTVYFQVGTSKVYLKAATDYTGIDDDATIQQFNVAAAKIDEINALGAPLQLVISQGAFKSDGPIDCSAATLTATVVDAPTLTAFAYNDVTDRVTFTFSESIDVAKFALALAASKVAIETTTNTFTAITGAVVTAQNGATVVIAADDTTARAIEAITLTAPKIRLTNDASPAGGGAQNLQAITNIETAATTPVQFIEKDYAGLVTLTNTPLALVSAKYYQTGTKLELTFNKKVQRAAAKVDSLKITAYVNGTSVGVVGTNADPALKINCTEAASGDGTVLSFTVAAADDTPSDPDVLAADDAGLATLPIAISIAAGAITEQSAIATFAIAEANKVTATYVASPASPTTITPVKDGPYYISAAFDQAVDKTTAETGSNYIVYLAADTTVTVSIDSAKLLSDEKTVYLKTSSPINLIGSNYKLGVQNVIGKVGGVAIASKYTAADATAIGDGSQTVVAPILAKANLTGTGNLNVNMTDVAPNGIGVGDQFVLTYNKPVTVNGTVSGADDSVFTIATLGTKLSNGNVTVTAGTFSNQLVVTLGTGYDVGPTTVIGTFTGQTAIKALDGTTAAVAAGEATQTLVAPSTATEPKVASAVYADVNANGQVDANDTLTVTFDQDLDPAGLAVGTMSFANDADTATFRLAANCSVGNAATCAYSGTNQVVITLGGTGIRLDSAANYPIVAGLTIKAGSTNPVKNLWAVAAAAGGSAKNVTTGDTTRPSVASVAKVTVSGTDYLNITMSEPVCVYNTPTFADAFEVITGTGTITGSDVLSISSTDPKTVQVALVGGDNIISGLTTINVLLAPAKVSDPSGNLVVKANVNGYVIP